MKNKYGMIMSAEESFAREAALSLIVRRPVTAWHYIIPGMFIFDHLRRNGEIRKYAESFLSPRKIAITAAQAILEGADRRKRLSQCEEEMTAWLESLGLYSVNLHAALMKEAHILIEHYGNLMAGAGNTYADLIRNVYKNREGYTSYLKKLAVAEEEVNKALKEKLGNTEALGKRLSDERLQFERLREKHTDFIF